MNVIFLCTANTCRSPMAEYYLKSKNLQGVNVISRGFSCGENANPNSVTVMDEIGIDISKHISKNITHSEIQNADIIICMTDLHKQMLISFGANQNKIIVLNGGVFDPFGHDVNTYRKCRDNIFEGINNLIKSNLFSAIEIKVATYDDIVDISNIENECFSCPWSQNAIRESMDANTSFYIGCVNNKTVAYMGLSKIVGEGYVTNIAVLPQFRKQGIAKALLEYVILQNSNLEFISLEVRVSNSNAISLYEKFNFKNVGLRKRFYTNPIEDAIIMTKTFT